MGVFGWNRCRSPQPTAQCLKDPECRGILCARGGYGSARILEDWTWPQLETSKWLIGFSDITAPLWSLSKVGISGVHGPVLTTLAAEPDWFIQRLSGLPLPCPLKGTGWGGGIATGILLPISPPPIY